jgi:hypothetical protein
LTLLLFGVFYVHQCFLFVLLDIAYDKLESLNLILLVGVFALQALDVQSHLFVLLLDILNVFLELFDQGVDAGGATVRGVEQ